MSLARLLESIKFPSRNFNRNRADGLAIRDRAKRAATIGVLALLLLSISGCSRTWWERVRERERVYALEAARARTARGQCVEGLEALDRAEARIDIGSYAREAITARSRCYEKLSQHELAAAHRRLLTDFYTSEPMAFPKADGSSVFRIADLSADRYESPPSWLKIQSPRYSEYARRSKIVGRVVIAFRLAENGRPKAIRVLEMPHPLLATWAIDAIRQSRPISKMRVVVMPAVEYIWTFKFPWRWAD